MNMMMDRVYSLHDIIRHMDSIIHLLSSSMVAQYLWMYNTALRPLTTPARVDLEADRCMQQYHIVIMCVDGMMRDEKVKEYIDDNDMMIRESEKYIKCISLMKFDWYVSMCREQMNVSKEGEKRDAYRGVDDIESIIKEMERSKGREQVSIDSSVKILSDICSNVVFDNVDRKQGGKVRREIERIEERVQMCEEVREKTKDRVKAIEEEKEMLHEEISERMGELGKLEGRLEQMRIEEDRKKRESEKMKFKIEGIKETIEE